MGFRVTPPPPPAEQFSSRLSLAVGRTAPVLAGVLRCLQHPCNTQQYRAGVSEMCVSFGLLYHVQLPMAFRRGGGGVGGRHSRRCVFCMLFPKSDQ